MVEGGRLGTRSEFQDLDLRCHGAFFQADANRENRMDFEAIRDGICGRKDGS